MVVFTYIVYLAVSLAVTVWVARTLLKNGRIFLVDAFAGNEALADSVNRLLVSGFYLINIGWAVYTVRTDADIASEREVIEVVCNKIGFILIVLGAMHFMNMFALNKFRRLGLERTPPPPLPRLGGEETPAFRV